MPVRRTRSIQSDPERESRRGSTASPYSLSERREIAFDKFMKGWSNKEVADFLTVHPDTVTRYKKEYEQRLAILARENPGMLLEVVQNTIRALEELDTVRATAWREYERTDAEACPHCGGDVEVPGMSAQNRNGFLKTVLSAQEQRHKLFGLFGVKQEFFMLVQQVKSQQDALVEFMQRELCDPDREKLDRYLTSALGGAPALPALPAVPASLVDSQNDVADAVLVG